MCKRRVYALGWRELLIYVINIIRELIECLPALHIKAGIGSIIRGADPKGHCSPVGWPVLIE